MSCITNAMRENAMRLLDEVSIAVNQALKDGEIEDFEPKFENRVVRKCLASYGYNLAHGVTRAVWVCDDFVLKFEYSSRGYCAHEEEVYRKAVVAGFGEMFAECEKLQKNFINNIPVWIMECVEVNEDAVYTSSEFYRIGMEIEDDEERKAYFENRYYDYDACYAARERLEIDFGISRVNDLYDFLEENCVNDIHDANIGFNGRFYVLSDYAGF